MDDIQMESYRSISGRSLHDIWNRTIDTWLGIGAEYFADHEGGGGEMPLERMLMFEEPSPGILLIRSRPEIERILKAALELRCPGGSQDRDLFTEAVVRFWQKMTSNVFRMDCWDLKPARFKTSRPADWPHREAGITSLSFVERCPVEIRLWTGRGTGL